MAQTPTYEELQPETEKEWFIWGPNSGGAAGLLFARGQIWFFDAANWFPEITGSPMSPEAFLAKHGEDQRRGYSSAAAFLKARASRKP